MNLQNLIIIFIIIIIPIILITSYYITKQQETLTLQTTYDIKLIESTKQAMEAFEINTVEWNSEFSGVQDSKRRDVMAAITTFTTSMGNNLGIAGTRKKEIMSYIPAIAFTLYDGFYIYAPTDTKTVSLDENGLAQYEEETEEGVQKVKFENTTTYQHTLKPIMPYTEEVKGSDDKLYIIQYTLDNYVIIYNLQDGSKEEGYLVPTEETIEGEMLSEIIEDTDSEELIVNNYNYVYDINKQKVYFDNSDNAFIINNGKRINIDYIDEENNIKVNVGNTLCRYKEILYGERIIYQLLNGEDKGKIYEDINGSEIHVISEDVLKKDYSAMLYYEKAKKFTNYFNNLYLKSEVESESESTGGTTNPNPFEIDDENNPEKNDSIFSQHKMEVMQKAINRNLNLALTSYSENSPQEYYLPALTAEDWEKVFSNISIITFFQNVPIGLKDYNNYAIAKSTNNKEYVSPNELYYTTNHDLYYHKKNCNKIEGEATEIQAYRSIKYNKVQTSNNKKYFLHNKKACYNCIVNSGNYVFVEEAEEKYNKAYNTAIARERYIQAR